MNLKTLLLAILAMGGACARPASENPPSSSAVVEPPILTPVPAARITTSSVLRQFNANGLLRAAEPGWHANSPPVYPEWIEISFDDMQTVGGLALLPQDANFARGPRQLVVETSADGTTWAPIAMIDHACNGPNQRWRSHPFGSPTRTQHLRLTIFSNCGDRTLLTLRGIRVE